MSSEQQAVKPPTQVAGVQGFVAFESKPTEPAPSIPWEWLCELPPFQMYAAERMPNTSGSDSACHARDLLKQNGIGVDVYDDYCQWHAAKGYWQNETPLGEVMLCSL